MRASKDSMDGPGYKSVLNEKEGSASRITREGKRYTYKLKVIQQPHHARACGSGQKSHSDRRPVDPPPILEMKIYEGEDHELKDITFSHNASFLLATSLEQARNIAPGRGQQGSLSSGDLTGSTVTSMAYLERPDPAGYFIFPDLSVRHEGQYRLSFTLYEILKDGKDENRGEEIADPASWPSGCIFRMEVRSVPFAVFSAKKFPGLTTSTELSRAIAEQGCKVRIRRDVRMRPRKNPQKDWDAYEAETRQLRAHSHSSATPEAPGFGRLPYMDPVSRPRSGSNGSLATLAPYSRRPSLQELEQGLHANGTAPHTPQYAYAQSSPYMSGPPSAHSYGPAAPLVQPAMQAPMPSYQPTTYQGAHRIQPVPQVQSYYGYATSPLPTHGAPQQSHRLSVDYSSHMPFDRRNSSASFGSMPLTLPQPSYNAASRSNSVSGQGAPHAVYQPANHSYQESQVQAQSFAPSARHSFYPSPVEATSHQYNRPPPIEPMQPPPRLSGSHTPLSTRNYNDKLPPINTAMAMKTIEPASPVSGVPPGIPPYQQHTAALPQSRPLHATASDSHKRNYGRVFNEKHLKEPLRQGARPDTVDYSAIVTHDDFPIEDDDTLEASDDNVGSFQMSYRRADGTQVARRYL